MKFKSFMASKGGDSSVVSSANLADLENRESKSIQGGGDGETDTDINTSNPKTGVSRVSLSGLLNFVDGLWSACAGERLIIFTTNHKEKLDPALLRAGRMDKHILLSYCNIESLKVLTRNYLRIQEHELMNEVEELLSSIQITTADVAECLMSFDENPYMGMRNLVVEMRKRLLQNSRGNEETKSNKEKQNTKKKMMMEDGNESDGCESDGSNGDEPDELDCSDEMMMVTTNMMMI
ncbi:hypothetical protein C5167_020351 [Papaver somniferum]|uniref:Uncharacterized protein n=1 Tax=Papaver somniferum TaxID=3469 RepID=A0A4Y7IVZ5_PAPSO|nr:hypothetical protein C5167_020351 [Papaver somniferum]